MLSRKWLFFATGEWQLAMNPCCQYENCRPFGVTALATACLMCPQGFMCHLHFLAKSIIAPTGPATFVGLLTTHHRMGINTYA